ncbi:peptidase M23 [Thermobifida halotolerans]|uniref:Peptidase M23 n=1 Tax=Thermobifida halotolerans TaxID=483545 RepID=A0A399G2Y0_9ACTN|nr:efflux RND transporter periplasmic adaptor subunit [Thermobifida halotolerans]UOE19618.1 peptidase M23 [Thermobifida halotolerans]
MKKWIILGLAVAVLLGGLGFGGYVLFSSGVSASAPESPDAGPVAAGQPVEVRRADIESRVVLDATIVAEPGVAVKARTGGTVARVWLADGQSVEQGAPVVTLTVPGAGGEETGQAPATETVVRAPATGTLSGLGDLAVGDPVEPGEIARITEDEFRAVASVDPNDVYRFYDEPDEILLQIDQGPAPEACEFLSLGAGSAAPQDSGGASDGEAGGGPEGALELACRVPDGLRVFPGVRGRLSIVTGQAKNALVVPMTAVRGAVDEGEVLLVLDDGSTQVREVELGISDGENIEVVSGLSPGDRVVDPVPLAEEFDVPADPSEEYGESGAWMMEE